MLKRFIINAALTFALIVSWPMAAAAADQAGHGSHQDATASAQTTTLGDQTIDGIKATAQLNDVREEMAKAGKETTHHLMIFFTDQAGTAIETSVAAVKITSPDGSEGRAKPMQGMGGHYGVDLKLAQPGTYKFSVGTKFTDNKKRRFAFSATVQ